ncbi:hypothetical protein ACH5RR_028405 [Cinchona calisaya]|uniref:NB-ARC domain-containing protein n=1 Tax=Cinchona calisaya TaxID=153742 RepID=A0ABD2YSF8_9GENT
MNQISEEDLEERILELLKKEKMSTIVLAGKAGIGKTWMARKVSLQALKEDMFDVSLWVYMSIMQKERALYQSIARQLSIFSTLRELEYDDNEVAANNILDEEDLEALKNKILMRLSQDSILLILDDEGKKMTKEENVIKDLLQFLSGNSFKVLITTVNEDGRHKTDGSNIVTDLKPLIPEKSLSLLQEKAGSKVFEITGARTLVEYFINRNIGLTPAEVVMIAKLLSYHQHDSELQGLEYLLGDLSDNNIDLAISLTSIKYNKVPDSILVDFNWVGSHFYRDQGAIHYSELISYWVMEGYLGNINFIDEAYEKGHQILMELMDLQILKQLDDNRLFVENIILDLKDIHHRGFGGTAKLGLTNVFANSYEWHGIGEVAQTDGTIKTPSTQRKAGKHSTLLLDGNCLGREDLENFLVSGEELEILGLFCSRIKYLPKPLSDMKMLSVLVLRGCDFLEEIHYIKELRTLTVLEVSDARSLMGLPDDFFTHLTKLRSLNLSGLQIEVLPKSVYDLTELHWLILKGCSNIKRLRRLKKWKKLVVLDLSGANSFKNFAETSFKSLPKLQFLDISNTMIRSLPFLRDITELTHLLVNGCQNLSRLPSIKSLSKLQVLDLSGAGIKEFQDHSFQKNVDLKILDLSETAITWLPSNICTHNFYLKGCSRLEKMNCLESPEKLEVLDLSGSSSLVDIDVNLFEQTKNLRILNLSRTKVKILPPLSNIHKLQELLLSCCLYLVKLSALNSLSKLEVLDLSGCKALTILEDESFEQLSRLERLLLSETNIKVLPELRSLSNLKELNFCGLSSLTKADFLENMSKLQILDLSNTLLEKVPPMSCFQNLTHLSLRNCRQIETLPHLEKFTMLEVLDLSGTSIKHLPSLKGLSNLRKLLLKDCFSLRAFADIKILDLSGVVIRDLPYGISDLNQLGQLALPRMENSQGSESPKKGSSMELLNEYQWAISSLTENVSYNNKILVSLSGSDFMDLLEKNHALWDTNFNNFHFSVKPIQLQNGIGGLYFHRDEYMFREIYLQSRHFLHFEGHLRLLEIHGFPTFPKGIEKLLRHSKYIFLLDNLFFRALADLGTENFRMMRGCWMDRCRNMESLMHEDSAGDFIELAKNLEILWISCALRLKNLYCGNLQADCFQSLKYVHLDCCPRLSSLFTQSQSLQNLEVLHIQFCDALITLFEYNSKRHTLPKLQKLHLWELPKLEKIGCIMPSLQFLEVGWCPMLKHVLPSTSTPENLKVVKVQYCDTLCTLHEGMGQENYKLPSLSTVELWGLPELTKIGFELPSLPDSSIKECPKLTPHTKTIS